MLFVQKLSNICHLQDKPVQARDALTKTVPKARIVPSKLVRNTTGAHYDVGNKLRPRSSKLCLKTAWKEPTPELRARYFAAKKKIVMQLLVFSLKPMIAKKKAHGTD